MTRNLIIIPVGPGSKSNYESQLTNGKPEITWGFSSSPANPNSLKDSKYVKLFNSLNTDDVVVFSKNRNVELAGVIKSKSVDSALGKQLWADDRYDLILTMDRVTVNLKDLVGQLNYVTNPNSACKVNHSAAQGFWFKHGHLFTESNVKAQPAVPAMTSKVSTYASHARLLTEQEWRRHSGEIDPLGLGKNNAFHLDHMYSIAAGAVVGVPAHIIASKHNLQLLPAGVNLAKNSRCSQTLAALLVHFPGYEKLLEKEQECIMKGLMPWQ